MFHLIFYNLIQSFYFSKNKTMENQHSVSDAWHEFRSEVEKLDLSKFQKFFNTTESHASTVNIFQVKRIMEDIMAIEIKLKNFQKFVQISKEYYSDLREDEKTNFQMEDNFYSKEQQALLKKELSLK